MPTLTPDQLASLWYKADSGSTPQVCAIAVAVALAESGGKYPNPNPSSGAIGPWQILPSAHPEYDATRLGDNPLYNAQAAVAISDNGTNWAQPWVTYASGAYKAFLSTATAAAVKESNSNSDAALIGKYDQTHGVSGAVNGIEGDVSDAADATVDIGKFLGKLADLIFTEKGWVRIFKFMAGVIIGVLAIRELFSGTPVGNAASTVTSKARDAVAFA